MIQELLFFPSFCFNYTLRKNKKSQHKKKFQAILLKLEIKKKLLTVSLLDRGRITSNAGTCSQKQLHNATSGS